MRNIKKAQAASRRRKRMKRPRKRPA